MGLELREAEGRDSAMRVKGVAMSMQRLTRSLAFRALVAVPSILAAAYFVLWACAPPASFPPPVPMAAGQRNEVGAAVSLGAGTGTTLPIGEYTAVQSPGVQLWYYHQFARRFDLGAVGFLDYSTLPGLGAMLRYRFVNGQTFTMGGQASIGWMWADVGLPMAWKLNDRVSLYSSPSFGFRAFATARLPVGLSVQLSDRFVLSGEMAGGIGGNSGLLATQDRLFYGALAGAFRF
jgi:hypothetical protein